MKRIVLCLLLCILLLPVRGKAEASDPTGFDLSTLAEDTVFLANLDNPSESILGLERHADTKRYPASTTKIMTCILALELAEPDALVTVSKRACNLSERNSKMGLVPGERFTMIDLLYGLMLPSGNDAAIAIAEHIGGSIAGFAVLMNEKAEALGMTGTHYVNPHGLHNDAHYTTARDLAVLTAYAMQNETFRSIVATPECTATSADGRVLELKNANRLLRDIVVTGYEPYSCLYPDAIGVKTGDTHLAGKCLVAAAKRNDTTYVLVLLHGQRRQKAAKRTCMRRSVFTTRSRCSSMRSSTIPSPSTSAICAIAVCPRRMRSCRILPERMPPKRCTGSNGTAPLRLICRIGRPTRSF